MTTLPTHRSEATGNAVLDRIQNNVRALVSTVRLLVDIQPRSVMLAETFSTPSTTPVATRLTIAVKAGECWDVSLVGRGSCTNVAGMGYALGAPPGSTVQGSHVTSSTDATIANWLHFAVDTVNAALGTSHAGATDAGRPDTITARVKVGTQDGYITIMAYAVAGTAKVHAKSMLSGRRTAEVQP